MIAVYVFPSAVRDLGPGVGLAGPAGPQSGIQGRRDHGAAARGGGAPPPGGPGQAGLGRPRDPGGPGSPAGTGIAGEPAGDAGNAAGWAPPSDCPQVDVPEPAGPPAGRPGDLRPGAAARRAESRVGVPPGARRTGPPRPSCEPDDGPADSRLLRLPACPARSGYLLAEVPARPGGGPAGV